jgi:hypothetical protein
LSRYNEVVTDHSDLYKKKDDINFLFSFRGAKSHIVRDMLMKQDFSSVDSSVRCIDRWFDHSKQEKGDYVQEILQSKFVLSPRGLGTASHRLFEIMELGRAPIIISDDWVPPMGPPWNDFSIRVAEDRIADLPEIVSEREGDWQEMGDHARHAWEQYYSPDKVLFRLIESIEDLMLSRPASHDESLYQREWTSAPFAWRQKWTVPQRLYRKVHSLARRGGT